MIYTACVLTGLLIGFLIKDWLNKGLLLQLERNAVIALKTTLTFLTLIKPLSPDEFVKKKNGSTGIGLVDEQMFLVRLANKKLETLSNIPLQELLGYKYSELKIVPYLPRDRDIDYLLDRINRLVT